MMMRCLQELGVDLETWEIPEGVTIVQMGDLVRIADAPGLDSLSCVQTAEQLMSVNPGRWIQIIGNHDAALLGGPRRASWRRPDGDDDRDREAAAIVHRWWDSGALRMAHGLTTLEYGPALLTHGGLTMRRWHAIGSPLDPRTAASRLNADVSLPPREVFSGGLLVTPGAGAGDPDVTWAELGEELYDPWIASRSMPFTQIHGHAAPWNWQENAWWPSMSNLVISATEVQPAVRRTQTRVRGSCPEADRFFVSTDWNLGEKPTHSTWPLLCLNEPI